MRIFMRTSHGGVAAGLQYVHVGVVLVDALEQIVRKARMAGILVLSNFGICCSASVVMAFVFLLNRLSAALAAALVSLMLFINPVPVLLELISSLSAPSHAQYSCARSS